MSILLFMGISIASGVILISSLETTKDGTCPVYNKFLMSTTSVYNCTGHWVKECSTKKGKTTCKTVCHEDNCSLLVNMYPKGVKTTALFVEGILFIVFGSLTIFVPAITVYIGLRKKLE